jgi:hypothetical protein
MRALAKRLLKLPPAVLELLNKVGVRLVAAVQEAWFSEPVAISSAVAAALVAIAGAAGVVIKAGTAEVIATVLIPIVLGAWARSKVTPTKVGRVVALAKLGSQRHVVAVFLFKRTALVGRKRIERLQAKALAEGGGTWPPTDEPERQTLYERFAGEVTPESKLSIKRATHKERGRWVVLAE